MVRQAVIKSITFLPQKSKRYACHLLVGIMGDIMKTSNWEDLRSSICQSSFDYIDKCIVEFTTLTEDEHKNLLRILADKNKKQIKYKKAGKKIICIDNREIYFSITELADELGVNRVIIGNLIKQNLPIKGRFYKYL